METLISKEQREVLDSILDEQERTYIQMFVDNEKMMEAVKKVCLLPIYYGGLEKGKKPRPEVNWVSNYIGNTDEKLGGAIRAGIFGISFLEQGFALLASLKIRKVGEVEEGNPAT